MQEEMIDYEDCFGTASGAVFCSEHNLGSCLVPRTYNYSPAMAQPHGVFFLPYLNVLLWIMLSAPGCFFDSQIKIPVMYQTNVYVTPAGFLSCNLSWKVCVWPFAAWKHSLNGIPGSPWYPLLCLNGNR